MGVFEEALIPSLALGCVYALVALGFVLLFRAIGILSFAQGAFMVFGALFFYSFTTSWHLGFILSVVLSLLVTGLLGGLSYVVVYRWVRGTDRLLTAFSTIGFGSVLEAFIYIHWGTNVLQDPKYLNVLTHVTNKINISGYQWFTFVLTFVLFVAIIAWQRFTPTGIQMRATADNESLASYYGIRVRRIGTIVWALGALCAAAGGIAYSAQSGVDPVNLSTLGIAVFPAIIVGGVDSLVGCIVGGMVVAFVSTVVGVAFGGLYQTMATYLVLLAMLVVRPTGIFGTPDVARI
jgi:branched-chain amino acid transport system permease protein